MNKPIHTLLIVISLFFNGCSNKNDSITGYWIATFDHPVQNPMQYVSFTLVQNNLLLSIDEPSEDWYEIPGEKVFFQNDSLYFERFWGLEKYYGKFSTADSIFRGFKLLSNKEPIPFSLQKVQYNTLSYKIPQTNSTGKKLLKYQYVKPIQLDDNFDCSNLNDVGIDSILIGGLVGKILSGEIPNIHSLLILKDNKLVLEEYFYNYSADKLHRVHSVTKSFTSALMGIAIDEDFIQSVNEPVWKYFPDRNTFNWVNDRYDIQIQHLLSMSAGLDWKGLTLNESNDDMDMYKTDDYFGYILNKNLKYTPGTIFCYNNGLSLILGHIIENTSKLSVDTFADKYLFSQIGITDYSWDIDDNGITRTDGGLKLRPRDMLKLGLMYLNDGKWLDKQIISTDWIHNSTTHKMSSNNLNYGYHWWIKKYNTNNTLIRTYYALGHGEQAIIVVPEYNLVFVMTAGNYFQPEYRPFEIMSNYILPSIQITALNDQYNKHFLRDFIGEYEINENEIIKIDLVDGALVAKDPSGAIFNLTQKSSFHFYIKGSPREILFVMDEQKSIVGAEVYIEGQKVDEFKKL